jgi:translation initiation factor IF-1
MRVRAGDVIVVEQERASSPARRGVIEEVLQEEPQRFRVCWEDGHTSIYSPSAGSAKIERAEVAQTS